jgi:RNA:NAD 2'-phosphotransferase (TPT1/KptA family)
VAGDFSTMGNVVGTNGEWLMTSRQLTHAVHPTGASTNVALTHIDNNILIFVDAPEAGNHASMMRRLCAQVARR